MTVPLKITRVIDNHIWKMTFVLDTQKLSESDKALMLKFGEPTINVGGTYLAATLDEYILPAKFIRVVSDLPYVQAFDSKSTAFSTATQVKAQAFQNAFIFNYTAAFTALRAQNDSFSGEFIFNI
jgi:hypothetical protein